jgi:hypothetical protein
VDTGQVLFKRRRITIILRFRSPKLPQSVVAKPVRHSKSCGFPKKPQPSVESKDEIAAAAFDIVAAAIRMNAHAQADQGRRPLLEDQLGLIVLIVTSVLAIAASLAVPKWAMLVYLVNFVNRPLRWLLKRKAGRSRKA